MPIKPIGGNGLALTASTPAQLSRSGVLIKIGSGGKTVPMRLIPKFNGLSQYALTPNINLVFGNTVEFEFIAPTVSSTEIRMMLSNTGSFVTLVRLATNNTLVAQGGTITLDGGTNLTVPLDGLRHKVVFTSTTNITFNLIGAQSNGSGGFLRFADFAIFNVKVNDGTVYNYVMDDGFATNPTMLNSGSGGNGQYVNATEAMWIEVEV